jgi:hypothetical protein
VADADFIDEIDKGLVRTRLEITAECSFGHPSQGRDVAEADFLKEMLQDVIMYFLHPLGFRHFEVIDVSIARNKFAAGDVRQFIEERKQLQDSLETFDGGEQDQFLTDMLGERTFVTNPSFGISQQLAKPQHFRLVEKVLSQKIFLKIKHDPMGYQR